MAHKNNNVGHESYLFISLSLSLSLSHILSFSGGRSIVAQDGNADTVEFGEGLEEEEYGRVQIGTSLAGGGRGGEGGGSINYAAS